MNKLLTTAIAAASATAMLAGAAQAREECGEIVITEMNWASAAVVTGVASFLMEQGYGCEVTKIPSSTTTSMASVAETGKPDIVTELWINSTPAYKKLSEEGTITTLGDVLTPGGVEGWWIPTYLVEAHPELATIDGILANPDLVGNRFNQCPEGWGCKYQNEGIIRALDLESHGIEVFQHGSGETMAASIASAVASEGPILTYYWGPTSVLGKYDMTQVDLGEFNEENYLCNADADCLDVGMSSFDVSPIKTIATTSFADDHPEIAELMSNLTFTVDQMNTILAWQEENNASAEEASVYFLTNYSDEWSAWVDDEAREQLAAFIQ